VERNPSNYQNERGSRGIRIEHAELSRICQVGDSFVHRCRGPTDQETRRVNGQRAVPIQLRSSSTHGRPVVADVNDTDEAIMTRSEVPLSAEDGSQQALTPSSFENSHHFVTHRRSTFNNGSGNDDREHFIFPDPSSPANEVETSSAVVGAEPNKSMYSEDTTVEAKFAAEFCGSPGQTKASKGKNTARDSREPVFLPLLKVDSHFPRQPDHERQTRKPRSSPFHSKLANLNTRLETAPEALKRSAQSRDAERNQKIVRHLRLQTLIQRDQIKSLKTQTKDLAETLKQLRIDTARDVRNLKVTSDIQHENSDRLVQGWEGMRRELLELKLRMAQEKYVQQVVRRAGDEDGPEGRRAAVSGLPFPTPHGLFEPTPMEYAFAGYHNPYPPLDPRNSNPPPPTTILNPNNLPSIPGATIAGPSFSRPPHVTYGADLGSAYNSVPLQYWDDHPEGHVMQNPQGCRWRHCAVCWNDGERGVWFE